MAEIDTSGGGGGGKHGGKVRGKKLSTKVDLTPMVDLAFLLITFFMLTTSLNKPKAMDLSMPKKDDTKKQDVKESQVLNVLLGKDDVIWYYGTEDGKMTDMKQTTFAGDQGIREVLLKKQKQVEKMHGHDKEYGDKMIVLIKMAEGAKYKDMVDILDEMDITKTRIYAIQDIVPIEQETIDNNGKVKAGEEIERVTR
ncbi:MAG: biopolymer transporter ExbD [Bacteroidetes bacterium]|nr:biopolymer transporter ExbD [Bacteroidota bacterium]MBS1685015.1 biopolymer transporter ExbD [Bacteroidota bacterium]